LEAIATARNIQELIVSGVIEKGITAELTWGETEYTQAEIYRARF